MTHSKFCKFCLMKYLFIYLGTYTEKDGKGDNGWCSCGWWCCIGAWWPSWHWIGTCIEKVGFIPYHSQKSSTFLLFSLFFRFCFLLKLHVICTILCCFDSINFYKRNYYLKKNKKCSISRKSSFRIFKIYDFSRNFQQFRCNLKEITCLVK